jgi:hypothetical protein
MAKKKKKAASTARNSLQPPQGGVAVRMYRHGLGDCFLLAFTKSRSAKPCYVLIDCGVHMRQSAGTKRLGEVMEDLVKVTGGKLDVVITTHEHADHLSGFVQKGSPFAEGRLKINRFWVGWTERIGDAQADRLRAKRGAARKTIERAVEKLKERRRTGLAERLTGLMDFERLPAGALAAAAGKKTRAGSNEVALELLRQHARKVEYCEPGALLKLPGVGNARAYVLGPPRSEVLLRRDRPAKGAGRETYLTARAQQRTFLLAPALSDDMPMQEVDPDLRHPFESAVRRECHFAAADPDARWPEKGSAKQPARSFCDDHYFKPADWRRIDTDWLNVAEQLALDLDNDTNNTSLTLAFELGDIGEGSVFLFVGDAQVGNWLSWRSQTYKARGRTFAADDLLARTILYKVGHHGSHNATVKRDPLHKSAEHPQGEPFGLELMPSRLIALIPVDQDAVRKRMPKPWHMPHTPLYERLLEKAAGRVLRSDGLLPTADGLQVESHAPTGHTQTRAPGLANVQWREAPVKFKNGKRRCPLYYDLLFEP